MTPQEKLKEIEKTLKHSIDPEYAEYFEVPWLIAYVKQLQKACEKISDPRKRDHKEPDAYTQLGCVMYIAEQAILNMPEDK